MEKFKLSKTYRDKWINELKTTKEEQGRSSLCTFSLKEPKTKKFCCLGIGINVMGKGAKKLLYQNKYGNTGYPKNFIKECKNPEYNVFSKLEDSTMEMLNFYEKDLNKCLSYAFLIKLKEKYPECEFTCSTSMYAFLGHCNDTHDWTFVKIAEFLEEFTESY